MWRVSVEVTKGNRAYYRMSLIRRGADVAQVTFTPAGTYDISQKTFKAMAVRAATRLKYARVTRRTRAASDRDAPRREVTRDAPLAVR